MTKLSQQLEKFKARATAKNKVSAAMQSQVDQLSTARATPGFDAAENAHAHSSSSLQGPSPATTANGVLDVPMAPRANPLGTSDVPTVSNATPRPIGTSTALTVPTEIPAASTFRTPRAGGVAGIGVGTSAGPATPSTMPVFAFGQIIVIDCISRERTQNGHNHTKHTQECGAARERAALASPLQPTCHAFAFFLDATTPCTNHL
jgi:hypothetical protein